MMLISGLQQSPGSAVAAGVVGATVGGYLILRMALRAVSRLLGRPTIPLNKATLAALGLVCVGLLGFGFVGIGTTLLFASHAGGDTRAQVGELRCETVTGDRLEVTFVPRPAQTSDGERYTTTGPRCAVSVDVLELRALPAWLGAPLLARVTLVGAHERRPEGPAWLTSTLPGGARPIDLLVRDRGPRRYAADAAPGARWLVLASLHGLELQPLEEPPAQNRMREAIEK